VLPDGFPDPTQRCIDGDPSCDMDGAADGSCTFRVRSCVDASDARLPTCSTKGIRYVTLRSPNPLAASSNTDRANASALAGAFGALGLELSAGSTVLQSGPPVTEPDQCTAYVDLRVPHAVGKKGQRVLTLAATDMLGREMHANRLTLSCAPNFAVCGNGVQEVGEECDDGNAAACDGCSPSCRLERCGNGIIDCGEQCDDG